MIMLYMSPQTQTIPVGNDGRPDDRLIKGVKLLRKEEQDPERELPRSLGEIQADIAERQQHIQALRDRQREARNEVDSCASQIAQEEEMLADDKEEYRVRELRQIDEESDKLQNRLAELDAKRQSLAGQMTKGIREIKLTTTPKAGMIVDNKTDSMPSLVAKPATPRGHAPQAVHKDSRILEPADRDGLEDDLGDLIKSFQDTNGQRPAQAERKPDDARDSVAPRQDPPGTPIAIIRPKVELPGATISSEEWTANVDPDKLTIARQGAEIFNHSRSLTVN